MTQGMYIISLVGSSKYIRVIVSYSIVMLMDLVPGDKEKGLKTPVWDNYKAIINKAGTTYVHHI